MTAHLTEPSCIWRNRHTSELSATTHTVHPGDQVTLCTAQNIWTVGSVHDDDTVTLTSNIPDLRVHRAHLDIHEPAGEVDGQLSIFDALDAS